MEILVPIDLDNDGFLLRECSSCHRNFKWFQGPTAERPEDFVDPENYYCPLCGTSAPTSGNDWMTEEQLKFVVHSASPQIMVMAAEAVSDALEDAFRGSKNVTYKRGGLATESTPAPLPLVDSIEMDMVASPCHGFEPVKIPNDWVQPVHCLICGAPYTV